MAINASSPLGYPGSEPPENSKDFLKVRIKHGSSINTRAKGPTPFTPLEGGARSRLDQIRHSKSAVTNLQTIELPLLQETLHEQATQIVDKEPKQTKQPKLPYLVPAPILPEEPETMSIFASEKLRGAKEEQKEFVWEGHTIALERRVTPKLEVFLDLSIDGKLSHSTTLHELKALRQVWSRSKIILQGIPEDGGYRLDDLPVGMRPIFIKDDNLVGKSLFIDINGFASSFLPKTAHEVQPLLAEPLRLEYDRIYTMNVDKVPAMMDLGDARTRFAVEAKDGGYRVRFLDERLSKAKATITAEDLPVTLHIGRRKLVDGIPGLQYLVLPKDVEGLTEEFDIASRSHVAITFAKGSIELLPLSIYGVRLLKNDRMVFEQQTTRTPLQEAIKTQNDREDREEK